jgi:tetratricopeptide (TPR) repeat protein
MTDTAQISNEFVGMVNESIRYAVAGDLEKSYQKILDADALVSINSLKYLWNIDQIENIIVDHCSRLASSFMDEGSDQRAMDLLTWQKQIFPEDFYLSYNFGRLASRRGDLIGSITHYENALGFSSSGNIPSAHLNVLVRSLAAAYQQSGDSNYAISFLRSMLTEYFWSADEKETLDDLVAYFEGENAEIQIRSGVDHAEETALQLVDQANRLDEAGDFSSAQPLYEKAIRLAPNNVEVLFNYGVACGQQAEKELLTKACQLYLEAVRLDPEYRNAHANLATLLFNESDFDGAAQHAQRAIDLGMDNYMLFLVLGFSCVKLDELSKARKAFNEALRFADDEGIRKINEILIQLPDDDATQPFKVEQGMTAQSEMNPTRTRIEPVKMFDADTFSRVGHQLAEAMGKTYVDALFGTFQDGAFELHFSCHDGDYKALIPDDPTMLIKIFKKGDGDSEVFTIERT